MSFTPVGIQLGPLLLYYFGVILVAALMAGGIFAGLRARQQGQGAGLIIDLILWATIASVLVARAAYVWNPPPSVAEVYDRRWFLAHPLDLQVGPLAIWSGGLSMAGALVGALLGSTTTLFRRHVDRWLWGDILAPAVLLGMFVSGWANIANQQMYGPPTSLPWGMQITNPLPPFTVDQRFHPTPAYLAIWALISLIVVLWIEHRGQLRKGVILLVSILLLMPGLFIADFLRVDVNRSIIGLTEMQALSLVLFVSSALFLLARVRAPIDSAEIPSVPSPDAG